MEYLNQIAEFFRNVPVEFWTAAVGTVFSAIIVSPIMLGIKKWFSIDGEKKMLFFVMVASLIAAVVSYLITVPEFKPWFVLIQGWLIFATTQPVYLYFVKPLFARLGTWFSEQIAKATMITEARAAAVPPEGLPIPQNTFLDDFSN